MSEARHFRSSPRPQLECRVCLRRLPPADPPEIIAYTRDLGSGGLFAATNIRLYPGESVEVVITTPSTWAPLVLPGEICWHKADDDQGPQGVGVRFTALTDTQAGALDRFVETLDFDA